jgi:predicted DNA-binding protein
MQMVKVNLNVRIEQSEMEILEKRAHLTGRTKTDIIREYIRRLDVRSDARGLANAALSSPNNTD